LVRWFWPFGVVGWLCCVVVDVVMVGRGDGGSVSVSDAAFLLRRSRVGVGLEVPHRLVGSVAPERGRRGG